MKDMLEETQNWESMLKFESVFPHKWKYKKAGYSGLILPSLWNQL